MTSSSKLDSDKIPFSRMEWDSETKQKLSAKEYLTPEDYIGAIVTTGRARHRIEAVRAIGGYKVVFDLLNLETGNVDQVLKMDRAEFDPESILNSRLERALGNLNKDPDSIIKICDRLLEFNPNNDVAAFDKAVALRVKGEFDQALDAYDLAIAIAPDDLTNWINKAVTLAELNRNVETLEHLLTAAKVDTDGVKSYFQQVSKQAEIIQTAIKRLLTDDPSNEDARIALSRFFN